jgi:hypothetical protein
MTVIKRCEKEVSGTWDEKRQQAKSWLDHFVPHYCGRCLPSDGCPAKHSPIDDDSKRWLDEDHHKDKPRIPPLHQLIDRMQADVALYIHGYNTCAVECAHGERTALTSKRIEYWVNWEGKCRLLQLLHNHRTRATGETLLRELGWQVMEGVSTHLHRIDRDKAKHHQIKTTPSYNARQKAIRMEKKARDAADPELIALAEARKGKAREKQRHYYHARKQLLYEEEKRKKGKENDVPVVDEKERTASATVDAKRKRGRPTKSKPEKENDAPDSAPSSTTTAKRAKTVATMDSCTASGDEQRPVLQATLMNRAVGVRLTLHPAMLEMLR